MEKEKFYITTTLPYVNAEPHIGFATEILRADVIARYKKLMGYEVFLNTGTDEHGQKVQEKAGETGKKPQEYVDGLVGSFKKLIPTLGIDEDVHFIRTTDESHKKAAQKMWQLCEENGDIYKAKQVIKYCVGCELEKTESELIDGKTCELHPNTELEIREEENYFFKFSKYEKPLLELYTNNPKFVLPDFRLNEIKKFVERGLQDFSVSRLKSKMSWGVPVPGDDEHVMYVWFDALTSYISTAGWPDKEDFGGFWPGTQLAGKDNLRQQSAIWQAMLMSAGLPTSKQVVVGGFINSDGQKMSKSLGNVISPYELVDRYGSEAARYLLLRHVHPFDDTDVTWERLDEWYTANLVNGLGNLTARIMKMAETNLDTPVTLSKFEYSDDQLELLRKYIDTFELHSAMDDIWGGINRIDEHIQIKEPFKKIKSDNPNDVLSAKKTIRNMIEMLSMKAVEIEPFMPETSKIILEAIKENKKPDNLFSRLESSE